MPDTSLRVIDPFTEELLEELPYGGRDEALTAVDAVEAGMPVWQRLSGEEKSGALEAVAVELRDPSIAEPMAELMSRETGKRLAESRAEVTFSAAYFDWFARLALDPDRRQQGSFVPGARHAYRARPLGIVAALTPWNFPVSIPARKLAASLAAGCGVLFKPSEVAPLSGLELIEVLSRHLPANVVRTVVGEPVEVATAWLTDRRVRGLSFTGSTPVGQALASQAAPQMIHCVLELGGNAPFVVLEDADIESAAGLLAGAKYRNNGQSCIAANHAWIPRPIFEEFVDAFVGISEQLRLGNPLDASTTLGPLTLPTDPERVEGLLLDAEQRGAEIVRARMASPDRGHFHRPAVIVDPKPGSRVLEQEIFGPSVAIRPYDDVDECLRATRECRHGLAGYVVTADAMAGEKVAEAMDVGIVGVNSATPNTPQVPFGGLKLSGVGYEGGNAGLQVFQTLQTVAIAADGN